VLTDTKRTELVEATKNFLTTVGKNLAVRKPVKKS
jgi:hypothetical protein